jgi:hypothetical protein
MQSSINSINLPVPLVVGTMVVNPNEQNIRNPIPASEIHSPRDVPTTYIPTREVNPSRTHQTTFVPNLPCNRSTQIPTSVPIHYTPTNNFNQRTIPLPNFPFSPVHSSTTPLPNQNMQSIKIQLPSFEGTDLVDWLFQAEQFFLLYQVPEE